MMTKFVQTFVKVTGWLPQKLVFRTKIYYEDRTRMGRRIQGPAILISNHTSVFDYAVLLFVFFSRTLYYQMAELLFKKKFLRIFLPLMGGIRVDRGANEFGFMARSEEILRRGGVVGIFPEGRLPRTGETRPLPFGPGAAFIAFSTGAPIIPVYTDGAYFGRQRARVIIGTPLYPEALVDAKLTQKENIQRINTAMREKIVKLEEQLNERKKEEK